METTLLILAAGMGSRYGGLKQIDPVGSSGETLLDYSIFDAIRSGFTRVVFVIRKNFEEEFRAKVGCRFEDKIDVGYVFQQINDLPNGFDVSSEREKPWGTGHAIWCARRVVDGPFLAINADDFYGYGAIREVGKFIDAQGVDTTVYCMAGYHLGSTLSPAGAVSRGICEISTDGFLKNIREVKKIERNANGIIDRDNDLILESDLRVSMNCWGFTPAIFEGLEILFSEFLATHGKEEGAEFYIPNAVCQLVQSNRATVHVLPAESQWFGITYQEDRPSVVTALNKLVAEGEYPSPLWS